MYKACNNKICIFPIWNQKSCSQDYMRIELLSRRNCSRLKWKSCSIWNGIPDVLRRAISVDPFSKQFEIVFRARDAFTVCVPLCICLRPICYRRRYGTLFDTPIYTKTKERWGEPLESENWISALQLNGSEKRNTSCLRTGDLLWLSQRRSNVFDNKFDDSILVVHFENWFERFIFFNLIQILFVIKRFVSEKLLLLFLYWNLELEFY